MANASFMRTRTGLQCKFEAPYIFGAAFDAALGAAAIGGADGGTGSPLRRETIQAAEVGICWVPGLLYVR